MIRDEPGRWMAELLPGADRLAATGGFLSWIWAKECDKMEQRKPGKEGEWNLS